MRLVEARVRNYRCVRDTGWFDVEKAKTILVGPNEAGKTAVLEALQKINRPAGVKGFDPLRDYPRKKYNADIQSGRLDPSQIPVVSARFALEPDDLAGLPDGVTAKSYVFTRHLNDRAEHKIEGGPEVVVFSEEIRKDLKRLATHVDGRAVEDQENDEPGPSTSPDLDEIIAGWRVGTTRIGGDRAVELRRWLDSVMELVDENNADSGATPHTPAEVHADTRAAGGRSCEASQPAASVRLLPQLFWRVRPNLHLRRFADRVDQDLLDDDRYDYGNLCLLKLLGFDARELADLGDASDPGNDPEAFDRYRSQLDERDIKLNAASVRLTSEIRSIWQPDLARAEADTVRVKADGQYLKVVIEDELGVEIELDQRSEGFQWLVSFFVVFFARPKISTRTPSCFWTSRG